MKAYSAFSLDGSDYYSSFVLPLVQGAAIVLASPLLRSYVVEGRAKLLPHPVLHYVPKSLHDDLYSNYRRCGLWEGQGQTLILEKLVFFNALDTTYVNLQQKNSSDLSCGMSQI